MLIGHGAGDASARGALQIALLDQIRFDDVFDGVFGLADRGSEVVQSDGTAVESVQNRFEQFCPSRQSSRVHIEHFQGGIGDFCVITPLLFTCA